MASFALKRGPSTRLNNLAIKDGAFIITTDKQELFADLGDKRYSLGQILTVDTLPTSEINENKFYFLTSDSCIYRYIDDEWLNLFKNGVEITTGTTNGTISVNGTDVAVFGLSDAAFTSVADIQAKYHECASDEELAALTGMKQGDICVVKALICGEGDEAKYSHTAYIFDDGSWKALDGNYNAKNVYFDDNMMVTKEIGYITLSSGQGTIPSKGKNLVQTFEAMFVKEANPKTTQPSVTFNSVTTGAVEVGTTVTPSWDAKLNAGSYTYGPATGITAKSWEISDSNKNSATSASGTFGSFVVTDNTSYTITAKASYDAGTVPVTNKGNKYTAGQITAGSKSATSTAVTGYRSFFYGVLDTSTADAPLTSDIIRGLTNGGNYDASKTFTLNGSATAKRMVIAIPSSSTRSGLSSVILTSAMNTPITDSYVLTEKALKVADSRGGTNNMADYDVYVYEPASIDAGEVHDITLG